jgi:hypothetical protein
MITWTWLVLPLAVTTAVAVSGHFDIDPNSIGARSLQSECFGCAKSPDHEGDGGTTYDILTGLTIGNGQCTGLLPNCVASACEYGGIVELKNTSGLPFWVDTDGDGSGTRVQVLNQNTITVSYPDGTLTCGADVQITIYASSTDDNPIARYRWSCSRCPQ